MKISTVIIPQRKRLKKGFVKYLRKKIILWIPHTAVAINVYEKYRSETKDNLKTIIASTASPYKFGNTAASAIGIKTGDKDEFRILEELEDKNQDCSSKGIKTLKRQK